MRGHPALTSQPPVTGESATAADSKHFYAGLALNDLPLSALMGDTWRFNSTPSDWHVVLTEVKKSTQALSDGTHHLVNPVATGSIIAALNIARRADIRVPFFFGGDGATLITPDCLLAPILVALNKHRENTLRNFDLELRVGSVPVAAIYAAGHSLSIAKAKMSEAFTIPVVLGQGLQHAESVMYCYVRDRSHDHIHFIDGIGGGYTLAATVLKRKLART